MLPLSQVFSKVTGSLLVIASLKVLASKDAFENHSLGFINCSTTDGIVTFRSLNDIVDFLGDDISSETVLADKTKENTNKSHLKTLTLPSDRENVPKLVFPKTPFENRYKMSSLQLDKGMFVFEFLRNFLSIIQPYDVPIDLLKDAMENRVTAYKFILQSMHVEAAFISLVGVCCILACVIPGTELWLACRPIREDYKPSQHPKVLTLLLAVLTSTLGLSMVTIMVCNEVAKVGVEKIPAAMEMALRDLKDYHVGNAMLLRKFLTRSLDVANEAIFVDLDNVEELLGTHVQAELASETGLDIALDALLDTANVTRELSSRTETLLKEGERAHRMGLELSREADKLRLELEMASRDCPPPDRSLCAILDPSGIKMTAKLERVNKLQPFI